MSAADLLHDYLFLMPAAVLLDALILLALGMGVGRYVRRWWRR
ncbi:MAG TPA: hypothetical protein VNC18_17625 [Gemmatimonadaceae bacterium]|jgi:hypothetical protein|nr:hypothetical protein [Gemmatimonadaceae bacterium]